ncbi:MAG: type VI secretion system lipoprotein TssJ [Limnobacter sp.]|nr:type VI secretion system lipoprotein TssJ [Limnobacter sp.]
MVDPYVKLTLVADAQVNPDGNQRPSPIGVKVMLLRSRNTLETLNFERSFYETEKWLADDLLRVEEFFLQPKESIEKKIELPPEVAYLAVVAGYRQLDSSRWKWIEPINNYGYGKRVFMLDGTGIVKGAAEPHTQKTP